MTQEELDKIVEQHQHWLKEDCEGWKDMRANLAGANLTDANLAGANLTRADLTGADKFRLGKILTEPLTGYKKTKEGVVITAEIPAGAIVFCINGRKCRTNKAKITKIFCEFVLTVGMFDSKFWQSDLLGLYNFLKSEFQL